MGRTIWVDGPVQPIIGHEMVKWPWGFSGSSGPIRTSVAMHGDTWRSGLWVGIHPRNGSLNAETI